MLDGQQNTSFEITDSDDSIRTLLSCPLQMPNGDDFVVLSRDRVVHLLALRPYKKPELILRLQKDRVVMKDKNQLSNILSQVRM